MALSESTKTMWDNWRRTREFDVTRAYRPQVGTQDVEVNVGEAARMRRAGELVTESGGKYFRTVPRLGRPEYITDRRATYTPATAADMFADADVAEEVVFIARGGLTRLTEPPEENFSEPIRRQFSITSSEELESFRGTDYVVVGSYQPAGG